MLAGLTLNGSDVTHTHAHMGSAHKSSNALNAIGGSSSNLSAAGMGGGSRVNSSSALNELGEHSVYKILFAVVICSRKFSATCGPFLDITFEETVHLNSLLRSSYDAY